MNRKTETHRQMNHIHPQALAATSGHHFLPPQATSRRAGQKCRLCHFSLKSEDGDDIAAGLCASCKTNPEAQELAPVSGTLNTANATQPFASMVAAVTGEKVPVPPRAFSEADLSLIRRIGAFMSAPKLLDILNERLACDLGSDDSPYTLEQLNMAIQEVHGAGNPASLGRDWPSVRKLLAQARRAGVLDQINEQVINDFAVVFQLNAKQVVELKDIVLGAKED
ncbi:hypothetical protein LJR290_007668 [Variovorax sp. LjRoot290]|uniref:hypothetical protein n=1 Tax=Variovorax sp. LjRoot290 TaxID=3342316 RepID=UPI003ECE2104